MSQLKPVMMHFIFFDIDGDITCTDDNSASWADSTFSVLNESATLTIEV